MVFDNAQVYLGITPEGSKGLGLDYIAVPKDELELLLVDGRGCQKGGFQTSFEPLGDLTFGLKELLCRLQGVLDALILSITQGDLAVDDVFVS